MSPNAHTLLDSMDTLPAMPAVAARILGFSDDTASATDVAQVISGDPALTRALLKVANSAYYGFSRQLATVREAVLLLGFKQVRQIAVGASLMSSWNRSRGGDDGFNLDLFWGHTLSVAMLAETGARKFNAARPEEAFTAGMLHDIGVLALRKAMPGQFREVMSVARRGALSLWDAEMECVGFNHAELGGALCERWQLPARLVEAIGRHHDALLSPGFDGLAGVVSFADRVADHHGIHAGYVRAAQVVPPRALPDELATLEIASGGIDSVVARAHAFVTSVSGAPRDWFGTALPLAA
jgi:putative nucleotidyltransferase with HDIG domain